MKDKTIQKATFMNSTADTYAAQLGVKVAPEIVNMNPARDVLRNRWAAFAQENAQLSAVYTVLTAIDFAESEDAFFVEGLCPPGIEYTKDQLAKLKKHYGLQGGLTNAAIAAMGNMCNAQGLDNRVMSEVERQLTVLDIGFRNFEEWAIINGDTASNPLAFNGLDKEVTSANGSLVLDLGGTEVSKADIDQLIAVQGLRGVYPTAIVANPLMINYIQQLYYPGIDVMSQDAQNDPYRFMSIPTPAGRVDLVPDPAVAAAASGDNFVSTIFVLTERHNGVPLLYMDYLIPESVLPDAVFQNGTTCTSRGMGIYAVGTLVSRANIAQAKIVNAAFDVQSALQSTVAARSGLML